jgi:hypothetical protein
VGRLLPRHANYGATGAGVNADLFAHIAKTPVPFTVVG